MNLYQPTITGSLSVSGSVNISGSITIEGGGTISGTASIATTALTASFVANAQTASYVLNAVSSSFALTASSADNLLVRNTLTAQTLVVQTITSSVDFVTGSTRFGSIADNTHVFTGSMSVSGAAIFSEQLTATSPSTLFKEGFIVKATTTGGGGSQPAYTYYTAAGSKRWSSFLNVGDDKLHIANALNSEVFTIIQSGSVGIGTTDPLSKSHTVGSSTAVNNSGIMQLSTGTAFSSNKLIFGINDGSYAWIQAIHPDVAYRNLVLQSGGGNLLIGTTTDNGRKLNVNGSGLFAGTLSTQKIEMGSIGGGVNITTNSTFTLISSDNFAFRSNMIVSVSIYWNNNANAQRQYLLFCGGTDTGWGTPNSGLSVVSSNDWSSGYVGAATFAIGGSGQSRTLTIAVANAATYNVTAYASILVM
jgi:hypothetical protein